MTRTKTMIGLAAAALLAPALAGAADAGSAIDTALAGDHRSDAHKDRDKYRHPKETLLFFGFEPGMTVVEIWPGGGWYTEVLAPAMRDQGTLIAAHYGENSSEYRSRSHKRFVQKLAKDPDTFDQVKLVVYDPPTTNQFPEAGSADMVVTFRNAHSMVNRDLFDAFLADAYAVLKPGGVLGIVQHRGEPDADAKATAPKGYLSEPWLIGQVEAAGFKLDAKSEINGNPKDTHDHAEGVWTLPPVLRMGEQDRERYMAIGESDRMTLRFVKPAG